MRLTSWGRRITVILACLIMTACASKKVQEAPGEEAQLLAQKEAAFKAEYNQAIEQMSAGELEKAEVSLKALSEQYPTYAGPLVNLGIIAYKTEDAEQADTYFDQALAINPALKEALNFKGVLAREGGRFDEAEAFYRQALEVDPNYKSALRNLGVLLDLYRGRLEEALALYEQYQNLQSEPDPKVKDWIFDTEQRLK